MKKPTLYENIGLEAIEKVIFEFYKRAFEDPLIGHFFFNMNLESLARKQVAFSLVLMGKQDATHPIENLAKAHAHLNIKGVHFKRRQVLFKEVLNDFSIDPAHIIQWLELEERLKRAIINDQTSCHPD